MKAIKRSMLSMIAELSSLESYGKEGDLLLIILKYYVPFDVIEICPQLLIKEGTEQDALSFCSLCYILCFFIGGVFKLELFLPEEYPMAAPKVFLKTLMTSFHCVLSALIST